MRMRPIRALILLVNKVQNTLRIQRAVLYYIAAKSSIYTLVEALTND